MIKLNLTKNNSVTNLLKIYERNNNKKISAQINFLNFSNKKFFNKFQEFKKEAKRIKEKILPEQEYRFKKDEDIFKEDPNRDKDFHKYVYGDSEEENLNKNGKIEYNSNYFITEEIKTREKIFGISSKIKKLTRADSLFESKLKREVLLERFPNSKLNIEKNKKFEEELMNKEDEKFNYEFLKKLGLHDPITIYEINFHSMRPLYRARRHAFCYGLLSLYIFFQFGYNTDFTFGPYFCRNFSYYLSAFVFFMFHYNLRMWNSYKGKFVKQIKYYGEGDVLYLYIARRNITKSYLEIVKPDDIEAIRKYSLILGDYAYLRIKSTNRILMMPLDGFFFRKTFFKDIIDIDVEEVRCYKDFLDEKKLERENEEYERLEKEYEKELSKPLLIILGKYFARNIKNSFKNKNDNMK